MKTLDGAETRIWNIVQVIRQLVEGRRNSTGSVTLRANQTTTVVLAKTCGISSRAFLSPETASAAATQWYIGRADYALGSFTIHHDSNAATDRSFGFDVGGG